MVYIDDKELFKLQSEFLRYIEFLKEKEMFSEYCRQVNKTPTYFYRIRNSITDRRLQIEKHKQHNEKLDKQIKEENEEERVKKITKTMRNKASVKSIVKKQFNIMVDE